LVDVTDTAIYQKMLVEALAKLEESNNRDGLTGIFNRRHLQVRLNTEFERGKRYGDIFSLVLFDLDHFKKVNDNYGHLGGDEVLRQVSNRITKLLRAPDIFGRYGGEEFLLVLPGTDAYGAQILAERLRLCIAAETVPFGEQNIPVTISIGISEFTPEIDTPELMIHESDLALYHSKRNGRNQVTIYDPDLHTEIH
jgi:diguanylate cyclase (GGDEF)-like protein